MEGPRQKSEIIDLQVRSASNSLSSEEARRVMSPGVCGVPEDVLKKKFLEFFVSRKEAAFADRITKAFDDFIVWLRASKIDDSNLTVFEVTLLGVIGNALLSEEGGGYAPGERAKVLQFQQPDNIQK